MWRWIGALALSLVAVAGSAPARANVATAEYRPAARVTVRSGETLWSIARQATPPGADVRVTVDRLSVANRLQDAGPLLIGQVLVIPSSRAARTAYAASH